VKIVIYGGTGNVGSAIVDEAAGRGHEVVAVSRRQPSGDLPDGAIWKQGDAEDLDSVRAFSADADAVVSSIGPSREPGGNPEAYVDTLLAVAGAVGSTRLAVVGGAGSLEAAPGVRLIDTPEFPPEYLAEATAAANALAALRALDSVDWTYLSPAPVIGPGERTGSYRLGGDSPVGMSISYADYALALVDELEQPAHRRTRFTVATA
jgi:putative NADH-flavin reductase